MKKTISAATIIGTLLLLSGCSVGMAMSGKSTPDLGVVKQNASRGEVELQLGPPVRVSTMDNGHVLNVYEYQVGNDPSAGRAAGHAVMDVLTLGIWEVIGTPIEGFQGDKRRVQIEYDENDRVVNVKGNVRPAT
ncbi:MAG: membrane lipoprotein lipid attachment site-containing protein [Nitrococcus mobilis]|nr:membrane lipoprotein lipid attachment site-containing protein [Nitrococcus mobilis]